MDDLAMRSTHRTQAVIVDEEFGAQIAARFGVKPQFLDGTLRVEIANGHRFLTVVVEAFPGTIHSIAMHKPTLEDVFLDETGVRIGE
jgi:ABC-2 type transport system ATP-binding protein